MARLEFWFEFASTYSHPAAQRIEGLAAARGVEVVWHPFLLGPIFAAQGWDDSPFNIYPAKGRYMWRDLERVCAEHGVAWRKPSAFPRSGLLAARVALAAEAEPWMPDLVRAVYAANFASDREIGDREVLADLLGWLGQEPEPWLERAASQEVKDRLRAQTDRARELEIFGAPSFTIGRELFWGHDRLEAALDFAAAALG